MRLECTMCEGTMSEHQTGCPLGEIEGLQEHAYFIRCPKCYENKLTLNEGDYWQCYSCATVFTCRADDWPDADHFFLDDFKANEQQTVVILPGHELRQPKWWRYFERIKALEEKIREERVKGKVTIFNALDVSNCNKEGLWTADKAAAIRRAEELYSNLDPHEQVEVHEYLCSPEELAAWLCALASDAGSTFPGGAFKDVTDYRDTPTVWSSFDTDRHKEWEETQ